MKQILFIDDDQFIKKVYSERLKVEGFEVTEVGDGDSAKEILENRAEEFSIICTDNVLPDTTAEDLTKWIREKGITLPIIVFSALGQEEEIQKVLNVGATAYLVKDKVMPSDFIEEIKRHI